MAEKNVYRYRFHGQEVVIIHNSEKVPDFFKYVADSSLTVAYIATPEVIEYIKNNNIEQCGLAFEWNVDLIFPKSPDIVEDIDLYIDDENGTEIFYTVEEFGYTREEIDMAYDILYDLEEQVKQYNRGRQSWLPTLYGYDFTDRFPYIALNFHNFFKEDGEYSDEYKIECVMKIICAICIPDYTRIEEGESIDDYAVVFDEDTFDAILNAPKYYDPS